MTRFALLVFASTTLASCGLLDLSPYEDITGTYTSGSGGATLVIDHQSDGMFYGTWTVSSRLEQGSIVYLFHTEAVEGTIAEGESPAITVGLRYQRCGDTPLFTGAFHAAGRSQHLKLATSDITFFWGDRHHLHHCEPMTVGPASRSLLLARGVSPPEPRWAARPLKVVASRDTVRLRDRVWIGVDSLPHLVECHPDCNRFEEQGYVLLTDMMAQLMQEDEGDRTRRVGERMHDHSTLVHVGDGVYEARGCGEAWAAVRIFRREAHWDDRPQFRSYYYPFHRAFGDTAKVTVTGPGC